MFGPLGILVWERREGKKKKAIKVPAQLKRAIDSDMASKGNKRGLVG